MEPVTITKIDKVINVFREGAPANAIEVIRIEDCEFNIIAGKGLYKVGDLVVYIMPDYCLPDNDMFAEYWRPEGLASKSKLGKRGRIRAVKFNFQFENETEPVYSNGIVLPIEILKEHGINLEAENLMEEMQIIKYVSEDSHEKQTQHKGLVEAPLPSFLYSTDEPRCLDSDTEIITEEGIKTIKEICDTKFNGKILSFNEETGKDEYKKILNHSIQKNNNDWFEVEIEGGKKIKVTSNHYFYLPELKCYRQVKDLKKNDLLQIKN